MLCSDDVMYGLNTRDRVKPRKEDGRGHQRPTRAVERQASLLILLSSASLSKSRSLEQMFTATTLTQCVGFICVDILKFSLVLMIKYKV